MGKIKLGDVIKHKKAFIKIDDDVDYKLCRVQLHRKGVALRQVQKGFQIKTKKQQICSEGDFLVAEMDAKLGGYGFVPDELDGAIVSSHYFLFEIDETKIRRSYIELLSQLGIFQSQIKAVGSTNYSSIRPRNVLEWEIPNISLERQVEIEGIFEAFKTDCKSISNELNNQLELISQLRQAFLCEAMQGKLVSNETSDGKTGADLLAEIQAEKAQLIKEKKIKKPKELSPISEDEKTFDIPENWTWCRLTDITEIVRGGSPRPAGDPKYYNGKIPFLKVGDLTGYKGYYVKGFNSTIKEEGLYKTRYIDVETLLLTNSGATLGIPRICNFSTTFNDGIAAFTYIGKNNIFFLYNFLLSKSLWFLEEASKGQGQPNLNTGIIGDAVLALPPLEIQKRIVYKLDELMQYCDNLENSVKESQQYNDMLLQQILREALEGKEESKPHLKINKTCDNNDTAILASYIIQELHTPDFGRTKLQKILHLAEYHCKLETPLQYYKKTAGPYSKNLENDIENLLRRNKLYDSKKEELKNSDKSKVNYIPLSGAKQINSFFTTEFKDQKRNIDNLLEKFNDKSMEFCEMISTMYAVWNNRLIKGETIDNEELKKDFIAWDPQKIKFLDKLDYSIEWIKKEGLEPTGFGKYIDKQ